MLSCELVCHEKEAHHIVASWWSATIFPEKSPHAANPVLITRKKAFETKKLQRSERTCLQGSMGSFVSQSS